ncbi:hypothetical protein D9M71_409480 [compost metagenome]
MHAAQYLPGQGLLLGQAAAGGGFEKHHQWAADALLGCDRCDGAHIIGQALCDIIGQLLGAGEENVAGFAVYRLAAEQAGEFGVGENTAKVFYGFERPVLHGVTMFSGELQRIQAIAISISRKHDFPRR